MLLLFFKYLTGALTFCITFAGNWLFEFTTTDATSRKRITFWGKVALPVIVVCLLATVTLTIWSDWASRQKEEVAKQKENTAAEEITARGVKLDAVQLKLTQGQADNTVLLKFIAEHVASLGSDARQEIMQGVVSLNTIKDFESQYPDLFKQLMSAGSLDAFVPTLAEGYARKVGERISTSPACAKLPIHTYPGNPFQSGTFNIRPNPNESLRQQLLFIVNGEGVEFTLDDYTNSLDLSKGYAVEFADGSKSETLRCTGSKSSMKCSTGLSAGAKRVYRLLQQKPVAIVHTDQASFTVDSATANELKRTFSCIEP